MPTIIEQIQRDALDPNVPISALLRRVKLAAVKLGLGAVEDWVEQELSGYKGTLPEYRIIRGSPVAYHPIYGWTRMGGDPSTLEALSRRGTGQSVASLESLIEANKQSTLLIHFSEDVAKQLHENDKFWSNFAVEFHRSAVVGLLDQVRNLVLDWAIKLEQAGVMGTEFSFAPEERHRAQAGSMSITIGNIGSFAGNLGSGNSSGDITASNINVDQVQRLVEQVRQYADDLVKDGADRNDLERELSAIEKETSKPSPDSGVLRGLITDLRNTISGAAGSLVASGVITVANQILGTGVPGS
jgi:hypothetical protein